MQVDQDALPESEPSIELDKRRRTRRLAIAAAIGAVAVGAGLLLLFRSLEAKAQQKIDQEWSRLSHCMIGDSPLGPAESASLRFRNSQLSAMVLAADKRAEAGAMPWPARCAPAAHGLAEAWREAGRASSDGKDIAGAAEELAKLLKSLEADPVIADLSSPVQSVWDRAVAAGLAAKPGADGPAAPAAAQPMTVEALRPDAAFSRTFFGFKNLFDEALPGEAVRFVVEDKGVAESPFLCTVTVSDAKCRKLSPVVGGATGLRLLGTTEAGAEPLVFAGNRGSDGIFRADSPAKLASAYAYAGHVAGADRAAILAWDEGSRELKLLRVGKTERSDRVKLDLGIGNFFYSTALLWDQFLVRGVTKEGSIHLYARPVDMTGTEPFGPEQDIGPLSQRGPGLEGIPHITGCRTAEALIAKVEGHSDEFLTFKTTGAFSPPVMAPGRGGVLTCRNAEASLTQVTRSTVVQVRCTVAGCQEKSVPADDVFGKEKDLGGARQLPRGRRCGRQAPGDLGGRRARRIAHAPGSGRADRSHARYRAVRRPRSRSQAAETELARRDEAHRARQVRRVDVEHVGGGARVPDRRDRQVRAGQARLVQLASDHLKHVCDRPPSIGMTTPVVNEERGESRNTIRSATSSACPTRPSGCVVTLRSRKPL